jgi:2-aminoadipate transaminase
LAEDVLKAARDAGVSFLPGSYFSAREGHRRALRLSFGGLGPREIAQGIAALGAVASEELESATQSPLEGRAALV